MSEIARLFQAYADQSSLECIAIKASFVCQILLLQKPSKNSKTKDHCSHLQRRLDLWKNGEFQSLFDEGKCIQSRLRQNAMQTDIDHIVCVFSRLMLVGKVKEAINFISRQPSNGRLNMHDLIPTVARDGSSKLVSTYDLLLKKHPPAVTPKDDILLPDDTESPSYLSHLTLLPFERPPYILMAQPVHLALMLPYGKECVQLSNLNPSSYALH